MPTNDDMVAWGVSVDDKGRIWVLAGNYTEASNRTFYVYRPTGEHVGTAVAPSVVNPFILHGGALYGATDGKTQLRKHDISTSATDSQK